MVKNTSQCNFIVKYKGSCSHVYLKDRFDIYITPIDLMVYYGKWESSYQVTRLLRFTSRLAYDNYNWDIKIWTRHQIWILFISL